MGRGVDLAAVAALVMGLLVMTAGCHAKRQGADTEFSEAGAQGQWLGKARMPAEKLDAARAAITSACRKESYVNASKGLIVAETGLHEDVFELRDRVSYRAVPYGLGGAQRLEALLRQEVTGESNYSVDQAACVMQFAEHLQMLTEPLVLEDEAQKRLDVSAFNTASKEAQDVAEQEEKAIQQPAASHP